MTTDGLEARRYLDTARPFVSAMRDSWVPRSAMIAHPNADVRTTLMATLRRDGWEAIGAHCGSEVVRWLALAELAGKPVPSLLVLSPALRAQGGARITSAIARSVGDAPIIFLTDAGDEPADDPRSRGRSTVARWPLELDDFRTIVQLMVRSPRVGT